MKQIKTLTYKLLIKLMKTANIILEKFNYKIDRKHLFKHYLLEEHFRTEQFSFIQIGANDGVKFDDLYEFVTQCNAKGLVIEPLKHYFTQLDENYANYPNVQTLNCAVHATDETATIHHVNPEKLALVPECMEGIGSFNPDHHKNLNLPSEYMIEEVVQCRKLMDIVEEYDLANTSLMQIDTEGYDGYIIEMIDFEKFKPKIIKFEHSSIEAGQKERVLSLLNDNGYFTFKNGCDTIAVAKVSK